MRACVRTFFQLSPETGHSHRDSPSRTRHDGARGWPSCRPQCTHCAARRPCCWGTSEPAAPSGCRARSWKEAGRGGRGRGGVETGEKTMVVVRSDSSYVQRRGAQEKNPSRMRAHLMLFEWMRRMLARPSKSGSANSTLRSRRPGRISAGSSVSGRLVAISTLMLPRLSKPSLGWNEESRISSCEKWKRKQS